MSTKSNKITGFWGNFGRTFAYIIMILFAFMAIAPVIWLIINSFKSTIEFQTDMVGMPNNWVVSNYAGAWKIGHFSILFVNSIIYTLFSVGIATILSLMTGFAFAKIKSKATKPIYSLLILGILLTTQTLMVPIFIQVSQLDMGLGQLFETLRICRASDFHLFYNSRFGVILVYIGSILPIGIYLSYEYIKGIPTEMVEASRIDGATYNLIFFKIILPMSKPIMITLFLLKIPQIWNEFALINIMVSKLNLQSLPLGIYKFSGTFATDYGKQFSALVIGLFPMLLFYVIFRKQITESIGEGAVKG
ncbi:MAG: carbohydrate ABC transporter permease [Sphaerochaetaceae bacterium]